MSALGQERDNSGPRRPRSDAVKSWNHAYPAESKVIIREDSWKPGPTIKFREHEGRGYWKGDSWVEIK